MFLLILVFFAVILGLIYFRLIHFLLEQWERLPEWGIPGDFQARTAVSVLIPARNEADNILHCLNSLLLQDFPADLLEIIVIDDHSTDLTGDLVRQLEHTHVRLLKLAEGKAGKKAALQYGIEQAVGDLILTTDADCRLPERWVTAYASYFQAYDPVFMTGPVVFQAGTTALEHFQALDMLGTMLITGAGIRSRTIHMSNGANLGYPKAVFQAVGGFSGIDHLASGDDMLLMHKIVERYPGRVAYLKCPDAVVRTPTVRAYRDFIRQRLRWATKSGTYQDWRIIAVLGVVFLLCWSILLSPLLMLPYGGPGLWPFIIMLLLKSIADYRLLRRAARYFRQPELLRRFGISQLFHILYIAVVGALANVVRKYEWKGRRLR